MGELGAKGGGGAGRDHEGEAGGGEGSRWPQRMIVGASPDQAVCWLGMSEMMPPAPCWRMARCWTAYRTPSARTSFPWTSLLA